MEKYSITKILVPIDFSETSLNALDTAIAMAKRHNASLVLLNVFDTSLLFGNNDITGVDPNSDTETLLSDLSKSIQSQNQISVEFVAENGVVPSVIIKTAADMAINMIVMGTHGASGIRDLFIGSNAYSVIKNSIWPVLTVPPNKKWENFSKILFPVRKVEGNVLNEYKFIKDIIRKNNGELFVLGIKNKANHEPLNFMDQLRDKLKASEDFASTKFYTGVNSIDAVWRIINQTKFDLIVVNTNIDFTLKDFFVGPYAQQIINHSKIPVLTLRPDVEFDYV